MPEGVAPSCSDLTATLLVDGALPMIRGDVKGAAPVGGIPLTPEERAKAGQASRGATVFYPAQDEGVFFDLGETEFKLWFRGGDIERLTGALDAALKRAFPAVQLLDDVPHSQDPRMHARAYRVELGGGRLAGVSTAFTDLKDGRRSATVTVKAQQRAR